MSEDGFAAPNPVARTIPLPRAKLEAALPHADLRCLIMVLYHLTGDNIWLSVVRVFRRAEAFF